MIDYLTEDILPLAEAAQILPSGRRGRPPHVSVLYRWAAKGLRGVQLEVLPAGGTLCTSREALARFFERLAAARNGEPNPTPAPRSEGQRTRAAAKADAELSADGW